MLMKTWYPVKTIPRDGRKVDVWVVNPVLNDVSRGYRFTDVQMRRDGTGFGFIIHLKDGVHWEYLESDEGIYPKWIITHWMEIAEGPDTI